MFDLQTIVDRNNPESPMSSRYAVILSAARADVSIRQNVARTNWLQSYLINNRWPFKCVSGVYKGDSEERFLVNANNPREVAELRHVARYYQQESVLVLSPAANGERRAVLVELEPATAEKPIYCDNVFAFVDQPVASGPIYQTDATQARQRDAYTFDPSTGAYWIADLA